MVKKIGSITLYDVDDIAQALEMNPRIISEWFKKGKLKGKKVGKSWMITEEGLKDFFSGIEGGEDGKPGPKTKKKKEAV